MTSKRLSTNTGTELTLLNQTTRTPTTPMELMVLLFTLLLLSPTMSTDLFPKRQLPPLRTTTMSSVTNTKSTESTTVLRFLESLSADTLEITTPMETLGNSYPLLKLNFSITELALCRPKFRTLETTLPSVILMKTIKPGKKSSTLVKMLLPKIS